MLCSEPAQRSDHSSVTNWGSLSEGQPKRATHTERNMRATSMHVVEDKGTASGHLRACEDSKGSTRSKHLAGIENGWNSALVWWTSACWHTTHAANHSLKSLRRPGQENLSQTTFIGARTPGCEREWPNVNFWQHQGPDPTRRIGPPSCSTTSWSLRAVLADLRTSTVCLGHLADEQPQQQNPHQVAQGSPILHRNLVGNVHKSPTFYF